jgi:hypothetical protein
LAPNLSVNSNERGGYRQINFEFGNNGPDRKRENGMEAVKAK